MFEGTLQDVVVVDLSDQVAGPYCTRLLAGLGAEVIKIESPNEGDVTRKSEPLLPGSSSLECSALFHHLNASKKSVTLDFKSLKGRSLLHELIRQAGIVVESSKPGALESLGLGFASLVQSKPSLVVTSISSFGQEGPYRDYLGKNLGYLALGGMLYVCGDPGREPVKLGGLQAEYLAGLNAAVATLAAFLHAELTGEGQWVDVSIMESVVSILEGAIIAYSHDGSVRQRQGNRHGRTHPVTILPCKDGYVGVMLVNDSDWDLFARLLGPEELQGSRFERGEDRVNAANEIDEILQPYLMERTRDELFLLAQEVRLPFSLVLSPEELLDDPQHRARHFFDTTDHPVAGKVLQVGAPFKMGQTSWRAGRAPLLGEHTNEILCHRLNLTECEVWELRREGVI